MHAQKVETPRSRLLVAFQRCYSLRGKNSQRADAWPETAGRGFHIRVGLGALEAPIDRVVVQLKAPNALVGCYVDPSICPHDEPYYGFPRFLKHQLVFGTLRYRGGMRTSWQDPRIERVGLASPHFFFLYAL